MKCIDDQGNWSDVIYRTFYRSNQAPNVAQIKWWSAADTSYHNDITIQDTLYCLDEITDTPIFWTAISALCAIVAVVYNIWKDRKGLRTVADCVDFRTRIGKQVQENENSLKSGEKRFTKIEKCLIFLVEKAEPGAAAEMKLYDQ